MSHSLAGHLALRRNQGFLIPLAAVIVLGLAALALTISRLTAQSSQASVIDAISAQALYAAESGAQVAMHRLLFNVADRSTANVNCTALTGTTVNFTVTGLQACTAQLSCRRATFGPTPRNFYTLRSDARCGSGEILAERSIEVSAFF